ncbi:YaaC family protein [Terrilactibacillus laevilacticus]|uniref:YaaC family protein n=1 Tax=Terrilactibacillus laevilacticus TaxID=1380157 RepID=A0ABW5PP05_9BACI|nr:YaaC family protein [Terrilactibacillus laevilacticus]
MEVYPMFHDYLPFESTSYCQSYLKSFYEKHSVDEAISLSYKNGLSFSYYVQHSQIYYRQALKAPYEIKPMLIYYGMIQLLKACLIRNNPYYPENSNDLAHGLSTRKRKKQNYVFLQDSVRIQQHGLFSLILGRMFHMKQITGQSFTMLSLIKMIPEMGHLYTRLTHSPFHYPLFPKSEKEFEVSKNIIDDLCISKSRLSRILSHHDIILAEEMSDDVFVLTLKRPVPFFNPQPLQMKQDQQLFISNQRDYPSQIPELLAHYLILYNLSMICRYETDWWYDLLYQRDSNDISYIKGFLDITINKVPAIISDYLMNG